MLTIEDVSVRFGSTVAVDRVTLQVEDGERLSILGPSGSGKSTLLRAIAGLEPLATGSISWDGQDLASTPVHRRGFGLMFQDYVLFPHLDVAANVRFGLDVADADRPAADVRVAESLALVGLTGFERRLPAELSGGEQQRVALARALAPKPRMLMLDEPLGALDRALRRTLLDDLDDLLGLVDLTILYVTHDHEEALAIGDRVAVMRAGQLETVMPPRELWARPPSEFVARFLGLTNIIDAEVAHGRAQTRLGEVVVDDATASGQRRLLIRPDGFMLTPGSTSSDEGFSAVVRAATFRGDHTLLRVEATGQMLEVEDDGTRAPKVGDEIRLVIQPSGAVLLPLT
jgi:thiamine transport system ATP-binding protein